MICLAVLAGCRQEEPMAAHEEGSVAAEQEAVNGVPMTPIQPAQPATANETNVSAQNQAAESIATEAAAIPTKLGDRAFPLTGLTWVKGEPAEITPGKVYVVEFWATWCPPCITSIPHLTQLQEKYEDQGVVIVGVSNENVATVEPFVADMGDKMDYRVAVDTAGAVGNGYMTAFGQRTIPAAFVVDAEGRVVWYGHPMGDLDAVIDRVLAGTYEVPS